jgi:hypothetical protein
MKKKFRVYVSTFDDVYSFYAYQGSSENRMHDVGTAVRRALLISGGQADVHYVEDGEVHAIVRVEERREFHTRLRPLDDEQSKSVEASSAV